MRVVLDAGRRLEHLMTEVEVEVEKPIAVVVGLDAEQADSAVAGVGNDHRRMRLVGGRHSARRLELVRPRTSRTEPTLNGGRQPRGQECTTVKALRLFAWSYHFPALLSGPFICQSGILHIGK